MLKDIIQLIKNNTLFYISIKLNKIKLYNILLKKISMYI